MELISIIVPVYKVEQYLMRCLDSIREQTYPNLEIILVDDGSPDNCGMICDDYVKKDSRIQVIHKQNAGLGMARNSGLEVATGKYVVFVDSDDWLKPNMVQTLVTAAQQYSAEMVICGYSVVPQNGIPRECPVCKDTERYEGTEQIYQKILAPIIGPKWINGAEDVQEMCVWTNLYSMDLIRKYNLRFVNEREYLSEDYFFNISYITKAQTIVRVPELLYCYRYNETSLSNTFRPNRVKLMNNLIGSAIELLRAEGIYDRMSDRLKRTYMKKLRHNLMLISEAKITKQEKKLQYEYALRNEVATAVLIDFPKNEVPLQERILVFLLKRQQVAVMRTYIKMQIVLIGVRQWVHALNSEHTKK